ncbi:MAG: hypothetical protein Q9M09_02135 [Mariprofundaceae bacterium]|nr:hypothetical protein [Mariprofundaceae bacterium]
MAKLSLMRRITAFFLQSRQVMVLDHKAHSATKNRVFYPMLFWPSMILLTLVFAATLFIAGNYYKPFWKEQSIRPQYVQLQRLYRDMRAHTNDTMTQLGIRDEQINMLKQEIKTQQEHYRGLQERLHLYDSLLAARRGDSLQLLQFKATPAGDAAFDVELALVRGGTTPRWVSGSVKLFALDHKGKKVPLLLSNSKYKLPYRIESHTFVHETARWLQSAPPGNMLYAHVYDNKGKLLLKKSFALNGENKNHAEEKLKHEQQPKP